MSKEVMRFLQAAEPNEPRSLLRVLSPAHGAPDVQRAGRPYRGNGRVHVAASRGLTFADTDGLLLQSEHGTAIAGPFVGQARRSGAPRDRWLRSEERRVGKGQRS